MANGNGKKRGRIGKHHPYPKGRGNRVDLRILIRLYQEKHDAFHFLFRGYDLDRSIRVLMRLRQMIRRKTAQERRQKRNFSHDHRNAPPWLRSNDFSPRIFN